LSTIGSSAFYGTRIDKVIISANVTSIGSAAFGMCSALTSIIVDEENSKYDSRNNCNAVIETASNILLVGCKNSVIPNSVTSIGNSAFYSCSELTSVTIPNNVTEIGSSAFMYCSGLVEVIIPKRVTSIGKDAFYNCRGLTDVYCYAEEVPKTNNNIFNSSNYSKATLYVPASALEDYKATSPWSKFGTIEAIPDAGLRGDVNGDGVVNGTDIQAVINLIVAGEFDEKADVNEDGTVNGTDIQEVINIIVNAE
jgi:hypothetical protein